MLAVAVDQLIGLAMLLETAEQAEAEKVRHTQVALINKVKLEQTVLAAEAAEAAQTVDPESLF